MTRLFNEKSGFFLLDEIVLNRPSFQKIMADHVITDEEVMAQAVQVIDLLKAMEETLSEKEKTLVMDMLAELAVLYLINAHRGEKP